MTTTNTTTRGMETALRAAARERGLTMGELAERMGTTPGYLYQIAAGRKPWTSTMRERAEAALGHVPGQGAVYKQTEVVSGGSSYIRERARELGLSMRDLADKADVSYPYLVRASRGHRTLGVHAQARVEAALGAPVMVAAEACAAIDRRAVWDRMNAHGLSQNEVARRAGISRAHLSLIMGGSRTPSPGVLKKLHAVLFRRTPQERVMPAEVTVLGWRKGERRGMVVRGAGGPEGGAVRTGGPVPWGAEAEYAFRTGYDGLGRVAVHHVVERGCAVMLTRPEKEAA